MLLSEAINMVIDRVGQNTDGTEDKDQVRRYLSMTAQEISPLVPWWWLDKDTTFKTTETFTITGAAGTFTAGETITGGTSSSTAIVDSYDATNGKLYVYTISAAFTASETVTGGTSGATATYASAAETRTYTPIAGHVTAWWSFVDESNNRTLEIVGPDEYDASDIDRDDSGSVEKVFIGGMDATSGYPTLELWRTPSTTNETIRVRYRMAITTWTSSNDASDFLALGIPQILEPALIHGAAKYYHQELGNVEDASVAAAELARCVTLAKKQNLFMQGNRRYESESATSRRNPFQLQTSGVIVVT